MREENREREKEGGREEGRELRTDGRREKARLGEGRGWGGR